MSKKILVIGSLNRDITVHVQSFPRKGETILANSIQYSNGGKGANQAVACSRAGARVTLLGCVGQDEHGKELLNSMDKEGIDSKYIHSSPHFPTGMAFINVTSTGDNTIIVASGANQACSIEYIKNHDFLFKETDCVLLQMEIPLETVEYCINRAYELNKVVILNPAPANPQFNSHILSKINYILPNEKESTALFSDIDFLTDTSFCQPIITLGDKGCTYWDRIEKKWIKLPTYKVDVVDTVAAGDSFIGYFTSAILLGKELTESIQYATGAAALAVTKKGAQDSIPDIFQVQNFIGGNI